MSRRWLLGPVLGALVSMSACTAILGDFNVGGDGGPGADGGGNDSTVQDGPGADTKPPDGGMDVRTDGMPADSSRDGIVNESGGMDSTVSDSPVGDAPPIDTGIDSDAGVPADAGCPAGQKSCGGSCMPFNPNIGCGDPTTCAPCSFPNAGAMCNASNQCAMGACNTGFADCNMNPADGCEVNTTNDPNNCDGCGLVCALPNAVAGCTNATCTISSCNPGFADCNMNPADGCEINVTNDPTHCGTCTNACNLANAVPGCTNGSCTIAACNPGFADCNGNPADGCEINTTNDPSHCSSCTLVCPPTEVCQSSMCTCSAGLTFCPTNNMCTNLQTDGSNCGTCGHSCQGGGCSGGMCQPVILGSVAGNGQGIAVDATSVYFTVNLPPNVYKCPLTGCGGSPAIIFAQGASADQLHYSPSMNWIFVADPNGGHEFAITPTGATIWVDGFPINPHGQAEDATYVYFGESGANNGQIDKVQKSSNSFIGTIGTGLGGYVWHVAYDPGTTNVFGAINGAGSPSKVVQCPSAIGGACISQGTFGTCLDVAVGGGRVFYTDWGSTASNAGLYSASTSGLTGPMVMATGTNYQATSAVTTDATKVYFGGSGNVYSCAFAGCPGGVGTILASGFSTMRAMTNDSVAVYWIDDNGTVAKVAK